MVRLLKPSLAIWHLPCPSKWVTQPRQLDNVQCFEYVVHLQQHSDRQTRNR